MKITASLTIVFTISIVSVAFAHSGATGVVKERMDMMVDVAKSMKLMGEMIKGKISYDGKTAKSAALSIQNHGSHFPKLFHEPSIEKPSEALPAIWENWDEFTEIFDEMNTRSAVLAEIATTASDAKELETDFRLLGKTCSSCHAKFRMKQ